jgi:hypothetical protein
VNLKGALMNKIERFEGYLLPAFTLTLLAVGIAIGVPLGAWLF